MTIAAGSRLGPYEVLSPLGAGGMGEVYRARDPRLAREVAIKVLPSELATDRERLKRFEREARSASSLNHPAIVTIYEIGQVDSISYIAMELVDGKTLREALDAGALPVRRLLSIGAQVADGLAKAHAAGIVHRDLKPENVMVTGDGFAKILDFGLAKLTQNEPESGGHTKAATVSAGTEPGVVMGTVGYMSPEQAVGQALDFRSDQFSFGSVLYEMATGKRAFSGKSKPETLAAIIREEPESIASLNPKVPPPLKWIIERCLAKEAKERYASTEDLARDLASVRDHLSEASFSGATLAAVPRLRSRRLAAALSLAFFAVAAAAAWAGRHSVKVSSPTFQQLTFRRGSISQARFAPDGTIVYSGQTEGQKVDLFSVRPGNPESRSLGIPSASIMSISPAGEMAFLIGGIAFRGTLARAPLAGGAPREVLGDVNFADWSLDGTNLAVIHEASGKSRLEFPIGKVIAEAEDGLWCPKVSPKGNLLAYFDHEILTVVDSMGLKKKPILQIGKSLFSWSSTAEELWFVKPGERQLRAVSLEGRQRVLASLPGEFVLQDVSRDGRVLLERSSESGEMRGLAPGETLERDLSWLDNPVANDLSDDGKTLLFTESGSGGGASGAVYKRKTDGSAAVRLGDGEALALSPDGKWAMSKLRTAPEKLVLLPAGPGESRILDRGAITVYRGAAWYPDSRRVWFNAVEPGHGVRCYAQDIEGGKPHVVLPEGWRGRLVSPDGKFFAAFSADGKFALHTLEGEARSPRPIPGLAEGDELLRWSTEPNSIFVFHQDGPRKARIDRLDLSSGRRELWKEFMPVELLGGGGFGNVYLSADGKAWVYSYTRYFSDLFVVEGLK